MNIDQIIGKVLAGKASNEELNALDAWKMEAEENITAIKEMQAIDSVIGDLKAYKNYDVDSAWEQLGVQESNKAEGVEKSKSTTEGKVVPMAWFRRAAAACAVVIMGIVGWQLISDSDVDINKTTIVSTDEQIETGLEDGSVVKLDQKTTIIATGARSVNLQGRAFFDIAEDKNQEFTIQLPAGTITVLGTEFIVDTRNGDIQIFVEEGKVRYQHNGRKVVLVAGDRLIMHDGDITKTVSDGKSMTSWLTTKLAFRNESLSTVVESLSERFDVKMVIDDKKSTANCRVNTTINNESFEEVLNELSITLGLKYQNIDNVIHVVDSNC